MTNDSLGDAIALIISSYEMKVWREVAGTTQDMTRGSQGERRMEDENEVETKEETEEGEIEKMWTYMHISTSLFLCSSRSHRQRGLFM